MPVNILIIISFDNSSSLIHDDDDNDSVPLVANRHNSTMRAVLYRGEWQSDKTYIK